LREIKIKTIFLRRSNIFRRASSMEKIKQLAFIKSRKMASFFIFLSQIINNLKIKNIGYS